MNTNVILETYFGDGSQFQLIATATNYVVTRDGAVLGRRSSRDPLTTATAWFQGHVQTAWNEWNEQLSAEQRQVRGNRVRLALAIAVSFVLLALVWPVLGVHVSVGAALVCAVAGNLAYAATKNLLGRKRAA